MKWTEGGRQDERSETSHRHVIQSFFKIDIMNLMDKVDNLIPGGGMTIPSRKAVLGDMSEVLFLWSR